MQTLPPAHENVSLVIVSRQYGFVILFIEPSDLHRTVNQLTTENLTYCIQRYSPLWVYGAGTLADNDLPPPFDSESHRWMQIQGLGQTHSLVDLLLSKELYNGVTSCAVLDGLLSRCTCLSIGVLEECGNTVVRKYCKEDCIQ